MNEQHEQNELGARLLDLCARAQSGELAVTDFLTPREQNFAQTYLRGRGADFLVFGGYENAERRRIYILPEYIDSECGICALTQFGFDTEISAVRILPSGYRTLTHRDYLGSVLALGVERGVVGDILVYEDSSAVVFHSSALTRFFTSELIRVANDKVKVSAVGLCDIIPPKRQMQQINDTVASPRLDCVIGALCSLSRDKAKQLIVSGCVEVDFETEERPDRTVCEQASVSVRGYGKFRINSLSDKTRKGRFRLNAEKFL